MRSEAATSVRARVDAIDYLRFVSAIGVLWFHAKAPLWQLAYAGLTAFLFLSIALPSGDKARKYPVQFIVSRARRLLLPFLLWSLFYSVMKVSQAYYEGAPLAQEFKAWMILTGPVLPLWFLPYAFVSSIVLIILQERYLKKTKSTFLLLVFVAASVQIWASRYISGGAPTPLAQWAYALPVVLFATSWRMRKITPYAPAIIIGTVVLSAMIPRFAGGSASSAIIIGILATLVCIAIPKRTLPLSRLVAYLSMPIYLLHPASLAILKQAGLREPLTLALAGLAACCVVGVIVKGTRLGAILF